MTKSKRRIREYPANSKRPPPTVGGGFMIACRDPKTGVLIKVGGRPYEHASVPEAEAQARVLAEIYKQEFCIFHQVASVMPPPAEVVEPAAAEAPSSPATPEPSDRAAVVVERRGARRRTQGSKP